MILKLQALIGFCVLGFCSEMVPAAVILIPAGTTSTRYSYAGNQTPIWSGGTLLALENDSTPSPSIKVFGRDGQQLTNLVLTIPQAEVIAVRGFARGDSGLVVACGRAIDGQGRQVAFLALFPPNAGALTVVALKDYYAELPAIAPDGTIWTVGYEPARQSKADIIRHFDVNGKIVGSLIPADTFASVLVLADAHNQFAASANRLAFFAPSAGRYIELSLDGKVTADIKTGALGQREKVYSFALTNEGRAFFTTQDPTPPRHRNLYLLDTRSGQLTAIAMPGGLIELHGADGSNLVGRTGDGREFAFFSVQDSH